MNDISIAAKQKRAQEWQYFIDSGQVQDPALRNNVAASLAQFRQALAECAQANSNPQATGSANQSEVIQRIINLERRLEQLNEEARMSVVGRVKSPRRVKVI